MAKARPEDTVSEVTLMRPLYKDGKRAVGRFEVVVGEVAGPLRIVKVLEKNVSLVVGREATRASLRRQLETQAKGLGLSVE